MHIEPCPIPGCKGNECRIELDKYTHRIYVFCPTCGYHSIECKILVKGDRQKREAFVVKLHNKLSRIVQAFENYVKASRDLEEQGDNPIAEYSNLYLAAHLELMAIAEGDKAEDV